MPRRIEEKMLDVIAEYDRVVYPLRLAVTALVEIPKYIEDMDKQSPDWEERNSAHAYALSEALRIARLYADPNLLLGISREDVIKNLSEGLAE